MRQLVVLKPSQPMRVANASFKIKQGQVLPHPGYPVDPAAFDIFDDTEKGRKAAITCAAKNAELKNVATRHGITSMKTLAKALKVMAKSGPTKEDRQRAFENAKLLTKDGLVDQKNNEVTEPDDVEDEKDKEIRELKEKLKEAEKNKEKINPTAYLDQNTKTVVKRVKTAAKNKKISLSGSDVKIYL